jgi:hypothetical protein
VFRARTENGGGYGTKEGAFVLDVKNEYETGELLLERDDIDNPDIVVENRLHLGNKLFSPWYLRFDDTWDDTFDKLRYMTFDSVENFDTTKDINMALLTFDGIWDDTMDNDHIYNSFFKIPEELSESGILSPVIDLGIDEMVYCNLDFVCSLFEAQEGSVVSSQQRIKPIILIRYSEDNEHWSEWQLYANGTFQCRYFQYKIMFPDAYPSDQIEISKLHQKYSVFNSGGGVDLSQVLNNILIKIE